MITIYLIPVAVGSLYPLIMGKYGAVSYPMAYTAVLGFFFLGCAQIAVGLFLSSVTESQIIAAVPVSYTHLKTGNYKSTEKRSIRTA